MTWLALVLIGFGLADLGHSVRPVPWMPECMAAAVTVGVGLLAGLLGWDLLAVVIIAAVVVAWGRLVRRGFGRDLTWQPLLLCFAAVLAALLAAPLAGDADGAIGRWLRATDWGAVHDLDADRFLLVLGALLVQCSTGNVLVRLVLAATGTVNPVASDPDRRDGQPLKGGRLLGPMERLAILGLGLAGSVTAASLVIAAKGLIRWPEIQSFRRARDGPSITDVTEYFLVGSFVSWMIPLGTLVLLA